MAGFFHIACVLLLVIILSPSSADEIGRKLSFTSVRYDCELSNPCMNGATCINWRRNVKCECAPGYSGRTCADDIDECDEMTDKCQQECFNIDGGYTCGCSGGYELGDDGFACVDIDECADKTDNACQQDCFNNDGGYTCGCSGGYELGDDGFACVETEDPVDMCFSAILTSELIITPSYPDDGVVDDDEYFMEIEFGSSVAALGDLDGDGVTDLAVGAPDADDYGAVYILFMNMEGSVKAEQRISSTEGGLVGLVDDKFGFSVAAVGDLDGDGVMDLAVGATRADDRHGALFILFLNPEGSVKAQKKISSTEGGLVGLAGGSKFGSCVAALGDLDGDGVMDLAVGAPNADDYLGALFILFLNPDSSVKAQNKISSSKVNPEDFGRSVAALGDLDGDGVADLAVGDSYADNEVGAVYIVFLNTDGSKKAEQAIPLPQEGFLFTPDVVGFGTDIAALGDLDRDGVPDLAVGAPESNGEQGAVYIFLLNADGTVKAEKRINGEEGEEYLFGTSVAALGDLDGDGVMDLAVGAPYNGAVHVLGLPAGFISVCPEVSHECVTQGSSYECVDADECANETDECEEDCFNNDGGYTCDCSTSGYELGEDGLSCVDINECLTEADHDCAPGQSGPCFNLIGSYQCGCPDGYEPSQDGESCVVGMCHSPGSVMGEQRTVSATYFRSLARVGDLDGDGVEDLVVGDPTGGDPTGVVYILFMNADSTIKGEQKISSTLEFVDGNDFGYSVAAADIDGDGVMDLAVGATGGSNGDADGINRGALHILLMNADLSVKQETKINWSNLGTPLDNYDYFGSSVVALDLDRDGVMDLAVGARQDDDGGTDRGAVYILFMNADLSLKGVTKISSTQGGLVAPLLDGGWFGYSLATLDQDGDGVPDLVVGAPDVSFGGSGRGSVHILLMEMDGSVKGGTKISSTQGGLVGPLDVTDRFGSSLAVMGDLDGDEVVDLVVGAQGDDDGGSSRGAVYLVLLNPDGSVKGEQKISSTEGGLQGPLSTNDNFGSSMAVMGKDLQGVVRLVVGCDGAFDVLQVPPGFVAVCAAGETCVSTGGGTYACVVV